MLRKQIIKKHINIENIHHVIGHNGIIFIKGTIRIILILAVLYILFLVTSQYIHQSYLPRIFGLIGIGFFAKYIINFLNQYLDSLILSNNGITLFMWEGLMSYKTDFFDRNKIETVSHSQNSFRDKIFANGDIIIKLYDIEFPFENVSYPQKQATKIIQFKERFGNINANKKNPDQYNDNISILAEALGEVVKEYMDNKKNENKENEEEGIDF